MKSILPTRIRACAVTAAALTLAFCVSGVSAADNPGLQQKYSLPGTSWQVETIASATINDDINVTLSFDENGWVSGDSGCNQYKGKYVVKGYELAIEQFTSTKKICASAVMDSENDFQKILSGAIDFSINWENDKLTVTAWDGRDFSGKKLP